MSLIWSSGFNGITDPDAQVYIAAVEEADGEPLEGAVAFAISNFIVGCKLDGIWDAIKASCILAGARTRQGTLIPLRNEFDVVNNIQPANPESFNFVDDDYDRKTGLVGDGSTKYLNSNRQSNADPRDDFSLCVYITEAATISNVAAGVGGADSGSSTLGSFTGNSRNRCATAFNPSATGFTGFFGTSRASSSGYTYRRLQSSQTITQASQAPLANRINIYASRRTTDRTDFYTDPRLAFYSIGESLDLAKLDTRVTQLITDIGAAIP